LARKQVRRKRRTKTADKDEGIRGENDDDFGGDREMVPIMVVVAMMKWRH
jgi:hypothetical protein